ncbi:MAG: rod shape-determining protein RodA [Deltaproteobacteria bacterium]
MLDKKLFGKMDLIITLIVTLLIGIGVVVLISATQAYSTGDYSEVKKQMFWVIAGIVAMAIFLMVDYEALSSYSFHLYMGIMVLLIAVLFTPPINGASSWFNFGAFSIQPSEIAKIVLIISLAKHIEKILAKDELGINKPKSLIILLLHAGLPILLILNQPDFGTAMVIMAILVSMIFIANINYKFIGSIAAITIAGIAIIRYLILQGNNLFFMPHQAKRIRVFFDPTLDPLGSGYNVLQSQLAIGSGGMTGMGLFRGTQTQLGNIPAKTTDFIFSVIGEELGFVVCVTVVLLFVFLLIRGVHIARNARDIYGTLVATGVTAMLATHIVVNIGMTIGLVPVTGIPLPFISYGGSSLLTNMMGIGLLMNVGSKVKK